MRTRMRHTGIVSLSLVFALLFSLGLAAPLRTAFADEFGTPWQDVALGRTLYTVYLDLAAGQTVSGPLDPAKHRSIVNRIDAAQKSPQQRVTDPAIRQRLALLAQNQAIVSSPDGTDGATWKDDLVSDNLVTFYPNLQDSRGRKFEVVLPSPVSDAYANILIKGRQLGKNLVNAVTRFDYYKDVVRQIAFPNLSDPAVQALEAEFKREIGPALDGAIAEAANDGGVTPGQARWAAGVVSTLNTAVKTKLAEAGRSAAFTNAFGRFLSGFNMALTGASETLAYKELALRSTLMLAYLHASGEDRLAALLALVNTPQTAIDPALKEAVLAISDEVRRLDTNGWAEVGRQWLLKTDLGRVLNVTDVVSSLAALTSTNPAVLAAVTIYRGVKLVYGTWKWLDTRDDRVSVAGVAKTVEYALRRELAARFDNKPPTPLELEQWLLVSNMRLYADQMFYDILLQRTDGYDELLWKAKWNVDASNVKQFLANQRDERLEQFLKTLPRVYWAYDSANWLVELASKAAPGGSGIVLDFRAEVANLAPGECTTLRWTVRGAKSATLDGKPVQTSGTQKVCPTAAQTFELKASDGTNTETRSVSITVGGASSAGSSAEAKAADAAVAQLSQKAKRVLGPTSGSLVHLPSTKLVAERRTGVKLTNLIVEARFYNPYDLKVGKWDYGFFFRDTGGNLEYRLSVNSEKTWALALRNGATITTVKSGRLPNLDTSASGSGYVKLVVSGKIAYLFIDNAYIATLDVSAKVVAGDVIAVSGVGTGRLIQGKSTRYTNFTLFSLP